MVLLMVLSLIMTTPLLIIGRGGAGNGSKRRKIFSGIL
jgi:hypothetical protein